MKTYRVRVGSEERDVSVDQEMDGTLRVFADGSAHRVDLAEVIPGRFSLVVDGISHDLGVGPGSQPSPVPGAPGPDGGRRRTVMVDGEAYVTEVERSTLAAGTAGGRAAHHGSEVRAPMPGLLVAVHVVAGAEIVAGQPLIIMEAMKMQMEIRAPRAGRVRRVHVAVGQEIAGDQLIVTID